jgi:Kef-type K+ transport system membrane component KefB/mannitol/fructose-specific phosphotransferase system IIA component (Ntr-type)
MKKTIISAACAFAALAAFASHGGGPSYPNFGLPRVEEMMFLVLQIGVIIFAARLGGAIASMLKMPSILGELAAGIVIGPWALGGIGFGSGVFANGLFNGAALRAINAAKDSGAVEMFGTIAGNGHVFDATSPALYGIATLASIILLFLSGLETNLKMFLRYSFVGTLVGVGGVVASFLFGDLCAVYLLPQYFESFKSLSQMPLAQAITSPSALYMGIMSTATSVGITARILSERKKLDSEEGTTIMAGAVIDDVLGLVVLAIGNGIIAANIASAKAGAASAGMDWGHIGFVAVKSFGVWLGATIIGILAARRISQFLKFAFKSPTVIATMAFGLSLILAGFFECMGLAMIIGAYVMGLALSRTDIKHMVQETLTPVYTFLVPIFFCVMGMMVDTSALCSKPVLVFGAIYTVLAIVAKAAGCMIPSLCCGFNFLGSLRIGMGMVPRGEVALIIAGLGLSAGYLSQEIFGIGIMMTLITTVVAPPALVALFKPKAKGVKHPKASTDGSRAVEFELADESVAEIMMNKLLHEFRNEGFFVTCLSQSDAIWDVAIDAIEISVRRDANKIRFECTPAEEAIVMTAWMEVVSQVNDLARSIAKPIRHEDVDKLLKDTAAVKTGRSGVGRYLQGFVMLPKFKASSKTEAIEKMVAEIARVCPNHIHDVKEATEAVLKREASMPTGLDHGIAVPHGRTAAVSGIAGAVAILDNDGTANGCIPDYETVDNSQLNIIVLTLANSEAQTPYLQLMSFISRALRAEKGYQRLAECKSVEEMKKFFRSVR